MSDQHLSPASDLPQMNLRRDISPRDSSSYEYNRGPWRLSSERLQPPSPRRCATLRALFICRITWSFSTCVESDKVASALGANVNIRLSTELLFNNKAQPPFPFPFFLDYQKIRPLLRALPLNTDDNSMRFPSPRPKPNRSNPLLAGKTADSGDPDERRPQRGLCVWVNGTW